tara:strand:+ start:5453 stop:5671 length:219 start_codon:yes stop_codon:yes gene_type:complete
MSNYRIEKWCEKVQIILRENNKSFEKTYLVYHKPTDTVGVVIDEGENFYSVLWLDEDEIEPDMIGKSLVSLV